MIIYLVFSDSGLHEIFDTLIEEQAELWINPDILTNDQIAQLQQNKVKFHQFENTIDGSHEKSVVMALEKIEKQHPDAEIFVEYS